MADQVVSFDAALDFAMSELGNADGRRVVLLPNVDAHGDRSMR